MIVTETNKQQKQQFYQRQWKLRREIRQKLKFAAVLQY